MNISVSYWGILPRVKRLMNERKFRRKKEDFICARCGVAVTGDGYTNHCPACLFSRHVDVFPGDRAASCGGLMEPVSSRMKNGEERILHRCVVCGHERENRVDDGDDRNVLLRMARDAADRLSKR